VSNISRRRPALNVPLLALWAASIGVTVLGYALLQRGNADLAAFYTAGGSDYQQFLGLQSQGTIGGMLLTAGVVGGFIALATHARNRAATLLAPNATVEVGETDHPHDVLYIEDIDHGAESADAAPQRDAPATPSASDGSDATDASESTDAPETERLEPASARG